MPLDPLTPDERSERMSRVRSNNTKPEMIVRQMIFHLGYRYRVHVKDLPGKPDLVFRKRKKVIFVHGCFWHLHDCNRYKLPATRTEYWLPKLIQNAERDKKNLDLLINNGWKVLVIWECELENERNLSSKITKFLEDT